MQIYVSNKEIAQIAKSLVQISCGEPPPKHIDIDAIAEYLGLTVLYEQFAEKDQDKIGFASNGQNALTIVRNGQKQRIVFPKNTIVLDRFLLASSENNRRRFTLAHEISHLLLHHADPTPASACFNRIYDKERTYSMDELHDRMNLGECQANAMAAMILMPEEVLTSSVYRHFQRKNIPVYGDCVFLPKMKPVLQKMSEELGVSYTTMLIQLRKYGLLEERDMTEFFKLIVKDGDGYV